MRKILSILLTAVPMLVLAAGGDEKSLASPAAVQEKEALATGIDAYIYGYPLVTMELTRRV